MDAAVAHCAASAAIHPTALNDPSCRKTESPIIHVVAGAVFDARGRVLLARREGKREHAGLWEFPGGKVEPGETPLVALARELEEEIGIRIGDAEPLICVPHRYGQKRIRLDVYRIEKFAGRARGMEAQAVSWVEPSRLTNYSMPAADKPVVAALRQPSSYLVTPEPSADLDAFLAGVEHALAEGVRRVQLRSRQLPAETLQTLATQMASRCAVQGAELLLNSGGAGGMEMAERIASELRIGLHLTSSDLERLQTRPLPDGHPVGASCHDLAQLRKAEHIGVDFAVLGPVAATTTHPDVAPMGFPGFAELREHVALPIYALGGLGLADHAIARAHGAQGIAAIRGLWLG
jgi:8-oxo-dGTP diphosphatase